MKAYRVLQNQVYDSGSFSIVPIRFEDRMNIMQWRNEQLYHLRQQKPLTEADQNQYFTTVVAHLFEQEKPNQILFSFLENGSCIGYGGLVHINWIDQHAEISFIMNTKLESERFHEIWTAYLGLIEQVAFEDLKLHKIFTYAFDLRPHLYEVLQACNFTLDARLKEHSFFDGKFMDVLIHSKIKINASLRKADESDLNVTFQWVNNPLVRRYSVQKSPILFEDHKLWFFNKISSDCCYYLILTVDNQTAGSIRFDIDENTTATVSYLIDPKFHGKGLGRFLLFEGTKLLLREKSVSKILGLVFNENIPSLKAFAYLGYTKIDNSDGTVYFEKYLK